MTQIKEQQRYTVGALLSTDPGNKAIVVTNLWGSLAPISTAQLPRYWCNGEAIVTTQPLPILIISDASQPQTIPATVFTQNHHLRKRSPGSGPVGNSVPEG